MITNYPDWSVEVLSIGDKECLLDPVAVMDVGEPVDMREGDVEAEVDLLVSRHDLVAPELEDLAG